MGAEDPSSCPTLLHELTSSIIKDEPDFDPDQARRLPDHLRGGSTEIQYDANYE